MDSNLTNTITEARQKRVDRLRELVTPQLNEYIPHMPTVKQAVFLQLPQIESLYGGAAGGGKSDALFMAALQYVHKPGYNALLVRKTFQQLSKPEALIPRSHEWLANTDASWNGTEKKWTFPTGSTLSFGYLKSDLDKYNYQGAAFQFIGFDEVVDFPEDDYRFLFGRLRRLEDSDIPLRMRSACNPIGPGMQWVKRRFVDYKGPDRSFVSASLYDNPHLDKEAYERALAQLPPAVARALRDGVWDLSGTGEVFNKENFHVARHVEGRIVAMVRFWDLAGTEENPNNTDPDWTSGTLMALTEDGRLWILDVALCRRNPAGVEKLVKHCAELDGKRVPVRFEMEPGQSGKSQVSYYARHVLLGWDVDGIRPSGDKVVRAAPLSAQVRQGNVYLVRGDWNGDLLDQAHAFPNVDHDDIVDSMTGAFNFLVDEGPKHTAIITEPDWGGAVTNLGEDAF